MAQLGVFELGKIASGVAIAASVSEISDSSRRSELRSVKAFQWPSAHGLEIATGIQAAMACEA